MSEAFSWERIMSFCNYIWYFLILNILFLFSNIPLFVFIFGIGISKIAELFPAFLLCLLPLGPSLCAIFHCMNKLIINKDIYSFREFVKGYKSNFVQSFFLGAIHLGIIFMLVMDIQLFTKIYPNFVFTIIFIILLVLTILITPNLYLLIMKFKLKNLQVIKTALAITIGKPVLTLGNAAAFLVILILFEITAGTTFLFMGSVYGFLIVFMNKSFLETLE